MSDNFDDESSSGSSNWSELGDQEQEVDKRQKKEKMEREISEKIGKMKNENRGSVELVEKLASMEYQLKEATEESKTTKERAEQAEQEKSLFKNKAYDLAARLSALKKRLQEKEAETETLQEANKKLEQKVASLKEDVKSTETHLNKSYNDTLEGLTNHIQEAQKQIEELDSENNELRFKVTEAQRVCTYLQKKLEEAESAHSAADADTKFKLTEAQRVSRFLEGKLNKMIEEKQQVEGRVSSLEDEVSRLNSVIHDKDQIIAAQAEKAKQGEAAVADASRQIIEIEGKLSASVKVCGFLESTLAKAEAALARRGPHPDAVKEINILKKKIEESNEVISSLNDGLSVARFSQKSMVDQVGKLQEELHSLSSELAEKEEQARNYRTKWQIEADKVEDLLGKVEKFKKLAEETKAQIQTIESEKFTMSRELDKRVRGMEGSLTVYTNQVEELNARIREVESEKNSWKGKADGLLGDIRTYRSQVVALQSKVAQAEAEKEKWYGKVRDMETAMAGMESMEDLRAEVLQAREEKKQWENKAEVLEVQLKTICDILRETKPDLAEMFSGENAGTETESPPRGSSNGGRGYAAGAAQSLLGNKAVLAVTLAAAVVAVASGDYSAKVQFTPKPLAFVKLDSDLVQADLVEAETLNTPESTLLVCPSTCDVDQSWSLGFTEASELKESEPSNAEDEEETLSHVENWVRNLRETRSGIWGKLKSMEKPKISDEAIRSMLAKLNEEAIMSMV